MNKAQHKKAVQSAATAFVNSTETLAKAVAAAQRDGVTSDEIREWLKGIVDSGNLSRVLIAAFGDGARKRAKRNDAGKSKSDELAAEFAGILSAAFAGGEEETKEEESDDDEEKPDKKKRKKIRNVADLIEAIKRATGYKDDEMDKIVTLLSKVVAELKKRSK